MTKDQLLEAVASKSGLSKSAVNSVVSCLTEVVADSLTRNERVMVSGLGCAGGMLLICVKSSFPASCVVFTRANLQKHRYSNKKQSRYFFIGIFLNNKKSETLFF